MVHATVSIWMVRACRCDVTCSNAAHLCMYGCVCLLAFRYESEGWNFLIIAITLAFCLLGFFQLPLVVSAAVWAPIEVICLATFVLDTIACARVRRNHLKRGWFVARVVVQLLFLADIMFRLTTSTDVVFALAVRPTYLVIRNRDIRIVVTGTMRSVANLALVAVIFVFVGWAALYGYLLFDFCAPEYTQQWVNGTLVPGAAGRVFNSSSCDIANWTEENSYFDTFSESFAAVLELLTAPSFLISLQQP